MHCAIVNVLPDPVTPSRTCDLSPRFSPSTSSSIARAWSPRSSKSVTRLKRSYFEDMQLTIVPRLTSQLHNPQLPTNSQLRNPQNAQVKKPEGLNFENSSFASWLGNFGSCGVGRSLGVGSCEVAKFAPDSPSRRRLVGRVVPRAGAELDAFEVLAQELHFDVAPRAV